MIGWKCSARMCFCQYPAPPQPCMAGRKKLALGFGDVRASDPAQQKGRIEPWIYGPCGMNRAVAVRWHQLLGIWASHAGAVAVPTDAIAVDPPSSCRLAGVHSTARRPILMPDRRDVALPTCKTGYSDVVLRQLWFFADMCAEHRQVGRILCHGEGSWKALSWSIIQWRASTARRFDG